MSYCFETEYNYLVKKLENNTLCFEQSMIWKQQFLYFQLDCTKISQIGMWEKFLLLLVRKKLTTRWRSDCEFHISLHHFIQTLWNVSICKWRKNFVPQIFIQIIEMFFWSTLIVNLYHPPLRRGVECQIKGRINQRKRD